MQRSLIKGLGHHSSGRWSRCIGGRYIERSLTKKPKGGGTTTWSLRIGGRFKKVVVKTGLTVCHNFTWLLNFIENVHLGSKNSFGTKL